MNFTEMYIDYYSGMPIDEISKKYHRSRSYIKFKCKQVTIHLYVDKSSFISKNINIIKKEVSKAFDAVNICPTCGRGEIHAEN